MILATKLVKNVSAGMQDHVSEGDTDISLPQVSVRVRIESMCR